MQLGVILESLFFFTEENTNVQSHVPNTECSEKCELLLWCFFLFSIFFFCLPIFSIVVLFGYVVILLFVSLIALKFEIKYHTTTCNIRKLVFVYRGKFELLITRFTNIQSYIANSQCSEKRELFRLLLFLK